MTGGYQSYPNPIGTEPLPLADAVFGAFAILGAAVAVAFVVWAVRWAWRRWRKG